MTDKINENKVAPNAPKKPILTAVPALIRTAEGEGDDEGEDEGNDEE